MGWFLSTQPTRLNGFDNPPNPLFALDSVKLYLSTLEVAICSFFFQPNLTGSLTQPTRPNPWFGLR